MTVGLSCKDSRLGTYHMQVNETQFVFGCFEVTHTTLYKERQVPVSNYGWFLCPSLTSVEGVMLGCCTAQRAVQWSLLTSVEGKEGGT